LTTAALLANVSEAEQAVVQEVIKGTKIAKLERAEVNGMYKAYMDNGSILYVHPYSKKIFFGDVYTSTGQNLTDADRRGWQAQLRLKKLDKMSYDKIKDFTLKESYNGGNSEYRIAMVTDPQCPYCVRAEKFLISKKANIEYIYHVAIPSHVNAPGMIETILSSKEPKKVIYSYLNGDAVDSLKSDEAKERMEKMSAFANKYGINGTPYFVVFDKEGKAVDLIEGANLEKLNTYVR
jgi:thiol:disulfide interchange protein DsbC